MAIPPTTPPTIPPIVPPETPFFAVGSLEEVDVLVVVAETLERENSDNETGRDVVGVADAWSCAREMGNEEAEGFAELSEE